jgi:hypothetical protein
MSAATPEDLANGIKLLERLRTGELNVIPGLGVEPVKEDASTAMLQRVEDVLRAAYKRVAEPAPYNEPAFPIAGGVADHQFCGASLRDYFAAKALPAVLSVCFTDSLKPGETPEDMFSRKSYAIADAMLKARQS